MRFFLAVLVSFFSTCGFGQAIRNVAASYLDGKVTVVYDLEGVSENQVFSLELFGSHNNFSTALRNATGDVGKNIHPGKNKRIEWTPAVELGSAFKGEITFRVKGEPMPMALIVKSPSSGGSVKKGKQTQIQWEGGSSDKVRLELYRGNERVTTFAETKNTGQYTWAVPKDLEKGSYTLKVNAGNESASSAVFAVKSKPPTLIILGGVAVVGGLIAILASGGSDNNSNNNNNNNGEPDLPAAPGPK